MPQVTAITPQRKNKKRFNLYLDGNFAFGIDAQVLLESNLKVGKYISEEKIASILKKDYLGKLFDQALNFLTYRPRSEKEIREYLQKKIAIVEKISLKEAKSSNLINLTVKKLQKYGYINDLQFANWLLESRTHTKPRGPFQIKSELLKKGIDTQIIDSVLQNYPQEEKLIEKAIIKKIERWRKLPPPLFKQKFYSYVLRRGFRISSAKRVFDKFQKRG